jgi:hypothetical protein
MTRHELDLVLDRLVDDAAGAHGDWNDVLTRAGVKLSIQDHHERTPGRRPRRRPLLPAFVLLIAAAAVALLIAVPALGLPQKIVGLFTSGELAPPRTERLFAELDRGAPPGLETHVLPGTARKALDASLPEGGIATLWVAPTARNGFCALIEIVDAAGRSDGASGPGCNDRTQPTGLGLTIPGPITADGISRGPVVVNGYSVDHDARAAIMRFENGKSVQLPLTWISEPIDAGFVVYGVPPANWQLGRLPVEVRFVDREGETVAEPREFGLRRFLEDVAAARR